MKIEVFGGKKLDISDELVEQYNRAYKKAFGTKDAEYLLMTEGIKKDSNAGKEKMEERLEYAIKDEILMAEQLSDPKNMEPMLEKLAEHIAETKGLGFWDE